VQRVQSLTPIEGADRIEVARVLGWNVIVQKNLYRVGDLLVFCEIDSVFPKGDRWSDLERYGYRVKTMKMKGVISQGYCFPLEELDGIWFENTGSRLVVDPEEGDDATDLIGVTKYEPPVTGSDSFMTGLSAGSFPSHLVSKTDEVRVQSEPDVIKEIWGMPFCITLKCDGTSMTVVKDYENVKVCSRNHAKKDDPEKRCVYWEVAREYGMDSFADTWPKYAIQAEVCGPGIQKNRMGLSRLTPFVFNIILTESRRLLPYRYMEELCRVFNFPVVPLLEDGKSFGYTLEELLEKAKGKYPNTSNHQEGIVVRADMYSRVLRGPMSFKAINQDFLMKEK
jgi:RNA ligase (TIGR02306 family)